MIKFKKHPARSARIMAGWLTASITVITTAAVLEDSVEKVDYSTALIPQQVASQGNELDLSGSATPADAPPASDGASSSVVTNAPAAPSASVEQGETPATQATQTEQSTATTPPTTAAKSKARSSRAS